MQRSVVLCASLLIPAMMSACTAFVVNREGRTFIGNNEDAWSINAQVRFEMGRDGGYGGVYFGHYNGSPMRVMMDQVGMNEAGLVYDGLRISTHTTAPTPGLKQLHFDALMPLVMRHCATVQEARAFIKDYDAVLLPSSMIFLANRLGGYLIIENDTVIEGHDPWYAVGNWRMASCSDPSTIPIPRLQDGRQMLLGGEGSTLEEARDVLAKMAVCRRKMGEGTLFSTLFEPGSGKAHLYFYHDFNEVVSFDLKEELAKGDRTVDMASLFGQRPEYERLKSYITPFHQRWLFWALIILAAIVGVVVGSCLLLALWWSFRFLRGRPHGSFSDLLLPIAMGTLMIMLIGVMLLNEGVFYFGLGDVSSWLAWMPALLMLLVVGWTIRSKRSPGWNRLVGGTILLPFLVLLGYWGLLWP